MKNPKLLLRAQFKEEVFARQKGICLFCNNPAKDAHHIIDRSLFPDGGYYLDNGVAVCDQHHLECEQTLILPKEIYQKLGIKGLLPPHFDEGAYDKWGNPIEGMGMRSRGELFFEDNVQEMLRQGGVLNLFLARTKYPRTPHLYFSPGFTADDVRLSNTAHLEGKEVVISKKMDGENTTMSSEYFHARSVDGAHHPSRDWVKRFWGDIRFDISEGYTIRGENLYAQHSIVYEDLAHYFQGFSMWDAKNTVLSWDDTLEWFQLLGITPVPVVYRGPYSDEIFQKELSKLDLSKDEGLVVRLAESFRLAQFRQSVAKWVRKNHVTSDEHWRHKQVVPNKCSKS